MLNTFLSNGKIIFTVALIFIFLNEIYIKIKWRIKWSLENLLKEFNLLNNFHTKNIIKFIIKNISFILLVSLQAEYQFINIKLKENGSSLSINVLTMYGIFYAFIQFLIGYTLQNDKDKLWGRSKTKFLLEHNIEFEFFNSVSFKVLLIISSMVPFLKINTIKFISTYNSFIDNLWVVSIFSVYLLYVLLFIKSLIIMSQLFAMEEKGKSFLEYSIKDEIEKEYNIYFRRDYEYENYRFTKALFEDIKNLNEIEKNQMFTQVIFYVMNSYKLRQEDCLEKIKDDKKIRDSEKLKTKYMNESKKMKRYICYIFKELWSYIEEENNIVFEDILNIYELKYEILFNEIQLYCLSDAKKTIEQIYPPNKLANEFVNNISEYLSCFQIPEIIWNKVTSYKELIELNSRISSMFIKEKNLNIDESLDNNRWLEQYKQYVELILEKYKKIYNIKQKYSLKNIFGIYNLSASREKIGNETQDIVFQYIISLEYNNDNKQYIKFLLKQLDYKYTIILIFYRMLYTGYDDYKEWKNDIFFWKDIYYNISFYVECEFEDYFKFVYNFIKESNIGHRIEDSLIKWIIENINNEITEDIINECNKNKYITYAKFLKFKYIFLENHDYYFSFDNINLNNLNQDKRGIWRLIFLKEILKTPQLLKESFFYNHQRKFYEKFLREDLLEYRYEIDDFRLFYINLYFKIAKEQVIDMIEEDGLLVQGICEFLILKIDEEEYSYLVSNPKIAKTFSKQIRDILDNRNSKVENYIDDLIDRANECNIVQIAINKKDRITRKIGNLIITK